MQKMKLKRWLVGLCIIIFGSVNPAFAAESAKFTLIPKVAVYKKSTQFIDAKNSFEINININTAEFALAALYGDFYGLISYDTSFNAASEVDEGRELTATREDYAVNIGYKLAYGFDIFVGYKDGQSNVTSRVIGSSDVRELVFRDNGAFAGISFSQALGKYGSFSLGAAYAAMAGQLKRGGSIPGDYLDITGDTTGLGLSAIWSIPVSDNQVLSAGYKSHRYNFTSDQIEYEQNFDMITIGVSTFF